MQGWHAIISEFQQQYTLKEFAKRKATIPQVVNQLVKTAGLQGDSAEYYFRLLATAALLGKEQMYYNWKGTKEKKRPELDKKDVQRVRGVINKFKKEKKPDA